MATLNAEDARKLARSFYDLAVKIGRFRFDNWTSMQDEERAQLEKLEWALLTQSSELATRAISISTDDLDAAIDDVSRATKKMTRDLQRIGDAKRAIRIASKALRLGEAVFTGNPVAIANAASAIISVTGVDEEET
ncbi:MAG: hypothetical protein ABR582_06305 [Gemmatimonadaceae bacterium]